MKKMGLICSLLLLISSFWSCNKDLVEYSQGDIKVKIVEGDEWLHDFPLFLCINKKNPPQKGKKHTRKRQKQQCRLDVIVPLPC